MARVLLVRIVCIVQNETVDKRRIQLVKLMVAKAGPQAEGRGTALHLIMYMQCEAILINKFILIVSTATAVEVVLVVLIKVVLRL
jgi:hypothetical protein